MDEHKHLERIYEKQISSYFINKATRAAAPFCPLGSQKLWKILIIIHKKMCSKAEITDSVGVVVEGCRVPFFRQPPLLV